MANAQLRIGSRFGKYDIISLIGQGGMGDVYEAHDTQKNRTVALKILSPQHSGNEQFRTRFQRESHAAAVLQEPHVIPIHDWGEVDGNLFIDMRLVRGQNLHELLAGGPLQPARAASIVVQVAAALDAAHQAGLIHRDVKPQNIVVNEADFAYLVDFGIAEGHGDSRLTMAGTAVGSFAYMAPERFDDAPATPAVDVYSLACVLYEALTGDRPFPANTVSQVIAAHVSSPPPRPSAVNHRVPEAFDDVVARGMAKDPDDRYGSAGALGRAAERALRNDSFSRPSSGPMTAASAPTMHANVPPPPLSEPQAHWPTDVVAPASAAASAAPNASRPWLIPTIIAVAVALLLGGIGVVIGMLANRDTAPATTSSPGNGYTVPIASPSQSNPAPAPNQAPSPPPLIPAIPPLVGGLDAANESCNAGLSLDGHTGFGTHSGRGSAETTCLFAGNVLTAYWNQYGGVDRTPRTVYAAGAVPCGTVPGASCNGSNFVMQCAAFGSDGWITCTGGRNARVFIF
ncbi:serine/threonine-protein kinase [Mycolicibacterium madagascariense]|uniref:serine/threonine-protein kinase n=1 Tax=Mycolicibacterium madagascariense TaxID=212765 RepID=UPI0013CF5880|nr:serine/threonine-protein kinase [Mycolicibacterium madagascariense]MCV7015163.1 serine/threonine protein kinase [Mycolicibacterium madagascariense]